MGIRSRVRVAKCQLLVTSLFVMLLGLSMAALASLTYFGDHFTIMGRVSPEKASFEAMQRWAFYSGICLAALLSLGSVLSALATVKEAGGLMAGGFLSFALVFCALVQLVYWRLHNPTQVEDALLDAYDAQYEQAVRSGPGVGPQELVAIQEVFQCCGKTSPLGHLGSTEEHLCRDAPGRQDCLRGIRNFLHTHRSMASALTGLGLATTAYALLLCSFLWLAIRSGSGLDRRGQYALSPRACTRQLRQPSFFRRIPEEPVPHSWPEPYSKTEAPPETTLTALKPWLVPLNPHTQGASSSVQQMRDTLI